MSAVAAMGFLQTTCLWNLKEQWILSSSTQGPEFRGQAEEGMGRTSCILGFCSHDGHLNDLHGVYRYDCWPYPGTSAYTENQHYRGSGHHTASLN